MGFQGTNDALAREAEEMVMSSVRKPSTRIINRLDEIIIFDELFI